MGGIYVTKKYSKEYYRKKNGANDYMYLSRRLSELEECLDIRESSARLKSARSMLLEVYYLGIERGKVEL